MHLYETHLHTSPVSRCAGSGVAELLHFYKSLDYTGVFITNHFLDGNIDIDVTRPYEERIHFYFSDYEKGAALAQKIGIQVFCGVEMSYRGTDFLIYGIPKEWWLSHPEIMDMKKSDQLTILREAGALVIQAHPFREAPYIDHIRLFPRHVHGVEVYNASCSEQANRMAEIYAQTYGLLKSAGSDTHSVAKKKLGGICTKTPLQNEQDFIHRFLNGQVELFQKNIE